MIPSNRVFKSSLNVTCLWLNTRYFHWGCLSEFVAVYISPDSRVKLAGSNATFTCTSNSSYGPPHWHYYSLTPGSQPCGFGSYSLYEGISHCSSMPRISVTYSAMQRYKAILTISRAQLSDAGTYTCGGRNPYDRSGTRSVFLGVMGKCTLCIKFGHDTLAQSANARLSCWVVQSIFTVGFCREESNFVPRSFQSWRVST